MWIFVENVQVKERNNKKYLIMTRNIAIVSGGYFAILFGVAYALLFIANLSEGFKTWYKANAVFVMIVNDIVALSLAFFVLSKISKVKRNKVFSLSKISMKTTLLITLTGLAAGLFTVSVFKIPVIEENYPMLNTTVDFLINPNSVLVFIVFLLINSLYKEVLFRGFLYNELKANLSLPLSVIIHGVLYGLLFFQGNLSLSVYGFLGALLFVFLYECFDSLLAPFVAQVTSTGGLFIFARLLDKYITVESIKFIIPISAVITALLIIYLWKTKDRLSIISQNFDNDASLSHE